MKQFNVQVVSSHNRGPSKSLEGFRNLSAAVKSTGHEFLFPTQKSFTDIKSKERKKKRKER